MLEECKNKKNLYHINNFCVFDGVINLGMFLLMFQGIL